MRKPSVDDMLLAAMILEAYEATEENGPDNTASIRVAKWLRHQAECKELAAFCRAERVSVAAVRQADKRKKMLGNNNNNEGAND